MVELTSIDQSYIEQKNEEIEGGYKDEWTGQETKNVNN